MPIIAPPPDTKYQEETTSSEATLDKSKEWERYRRIQIYINVNNWTCPVCGATVFGRCKRCPYCWGRCGGRVTLRPADFKLKRTDV